MSKTSLLLRNNNTELGQNDVEMGNNKGICKFETHKPLFSKTLGPPKKGEG